MSKLWKVSAVAAAFIGGLVIAHADYNIPIPQSGPVSLVSSFVCVVSSVSKQCPAHVNIDSAGVEKATLANPMIGKSIAIDGSGVEKGTLANPVNSKSVLIDSSGVEKGTAGNPVQVNGLRQFTPLGLQTITSPASATGLTVPNGATVAEICVENQTVRYRDDGTPPTTSVGIPVAASSSGPQCFQYAGALAAIQFIQQVSGAVLSVSYYR